jgi:hypothetical protein
LNKNKLLSGPPPVTTTDDPEYYRRRAEDQITLAQLSSDARAVRAHYEIATCYLDRIHGEPGIAAPAT